MRPLFYGAIVLSLFCAVDMVLVGHMATARDARQRVARLQAGLVHGLGVTDLVVATEARYTRHPAVSDPVAPFMDGPGSLEHFPTGSFWAPVR